jgi:phage terminase large subunit-like protein
MKFLSWKFLSNKCFFSFSDVRLEWPCFETLNSLHYVFCVREPCMIYGDGVTMRKRTFHERLVSPPPQKSIMIFWMHLKPHQTVLSCDSNPTPDSKSIRGHRKVRRELLLLLVALHLSLLLRNNEIYGHIWRIFTHPQRVKNLFHRPQKNRKILKYTDKKKPRKARILEFMVIRRTCTLKWTL